MSRTIHGHSFRGKMSRTYSIWQTMRRRCTNEKHRDFKWYGGRGISADPTWDDFGAFLRDMGEAPEGLTLDRIDNQGPYAPWNCRWATRSEQMRNSSSAKQISFNGVTRCVREWEESLGLSVGAIAHRLRRGWPLDRALTEKRVTP